MDDLVHKGHRQRMRRKFSEFGARVFDTYELLEMLLYYTVPVKDTNPISKRLLQKFGSLDGVLRADKAALMSVEGIGAKTADLIVAVAAAPEFYMQDSNPDSQAVIFDDYHAIGRFLVSHFDKNIESRAIILSFDNNLRFLGMDELYDCDFSTGKMRAKSCVDSVVARGATVAVIANTNPHGPLFPTENNRSISIIINDVLADIGVSLIEHYVICGNGYIGFIKHTNDRFAQRPIVRKFLESKRRMR